MTRVLLKSSPRMWGWTEIASVAAEMYSNFPTHVGVNRSVAGSTSGCEKVPHVCGGGPECGGKCQRVREWRSEE
jgi:hypothetical protein